MSLCCCEEGKIKNALALGTAYCIKPPGGGEEIQRVCSLYSEIQERNFTVHFFKNHTFYFKPVPLYLPKQRGETQHSIWRGFSPGNPHISSAYTADVAQSCQVTFTSTISRLTATLHHKSFQRNSPAPSVSNFPYWLCSVSALC